MGKEIPRAIYSTIVDENLALYKEIYENTRLNDKITPYWKKSITMYNGLTDDQKETLYDIIQQTMIDTISNMLGIIDGSAGLAGFEANEFHLIMDQTEISGELQDEFLELIEYKK